MSNLVLLHFKKLPKSFRIREVGEGSQEYAAQFPFSWLAKTSIDNLIQAASGPEFGEIYHNTAYISWTHELVISASMVDPWLISFTPTVI